MQVGCTALIHAARNGHLPVVKHLTGLGADVAASNRVSAVPTVSVCQCACSVTVLPSARAEYFKLSKRQCSLVMQICHMLFLCCIALCCGVV